MTWAPCYEPRNPHGDHTPREGAWAMYDPIGRAATRVWVKTIAPSLGLAVIGTGQQGPWRTVPLQHLRNTRRGE